MARTHTRVFLALALLGTFFLGVSVKGELQQAEEEEEVEMSCQGAFDLYFVLDKWVSRFIYDFVTFPSLRIAMQPPQWFGNAVRIGLGVVVTVREKKVTYTL